MKRGSSFILMLVLLLMTTISGFAFSDITESTVGAKEIDALAEKGYIAGYKDGTFRPDGSITRAEFVTMINKAKGYEPGVAGVYFTDVPEDAWYHSFVKAGLQAGYFTGYKDNTFRPFNNISKEEVCTMLAQVEGLKFLVPETSTSAITIKDSVSGYAETFVKQCIAYGLMDVDKDGNFRATENATRADVAIACYRVLENAGAFEATTSGAGVTSDSAIGGGAGGGSEGIQITALQEEQLKILVKCVDNDLLPDNELNKTQKDILKMARDGIVSFLDDRTYDIKTNAKEARKEYDKLTTSQQEQLQNKVADAAYPYGLTTDHLLKLKDFFF